MVPKYLARPGARIDEGETSINLPYGLTLAGIVAVLNDVYAYLHAINTASVEHGYGRLEELMQPAGYSGLLSQLYMHALAKIFATATPGLALNQYPNGRPDLVPRAHYLNDRAQNGEEGIELKVSRARSGWQGHNPESGWIMIVQIGIDTETEPVYERAATVVDRVMLAALENGDWNFSGRGPGSRRTPTASINREGRAKLEAGIIYARSDAESA